MLVRPTLGWLLGRIWYVISGEEARELIVEMRALTRKTNELIARIDVERAGENRATDLTPARPWSERWSLS